MNDKVSYPAMSYFFEKIQALSLFWKKHSYCLSPDCIDKGIRFLATSSKELHTKYSYFYLTKILNAFCTFEKCIQTMHRNHPQKREIFFRLFKSPRCENSSLGIVVVLKVKGFSENFSKDHLLRAILHILPGIVAVPRMTYHFRDEEFGLLFIYQEIEKKRGRGFLALDIQELQKFLEKEFTKLEKKFKKPREFLFEEAFIRYIEHME